jgi:DNA polymerase-3 subunit delta
VTAEAAPVFLVKGDDPTLVNDAVRDTVDELVGDADRTLVVEELDADSYAVEGVDDAHVGVLVSAAETAPFLGDRRVVVARHAGLFSSADRVEPLVAYLGAPLETTRLVVVWEKGPRQQRLSPVPKNLAAAVEKAGGEVIAAGTPRGKGKAEHLARELDRRGLDLDRAALDLVAARLGEDVGRARALVDTLVATYGTASKLGADEVEPYLVGEGDAAPWDLTDAIDKGDIEGSLAVLHRMLGAGRHPLQLMYSLQSHYGQLLALDGADVVDEKGAAELLGVKGYPAKKAWQLSKRLESRQVREAIELLAQADLDLRGAKAWPDDLVMEVLVARLAHRCSPRR